MEKGEEDDYIYIQNLDIVAIFCNWEEYLLLWMLNKLYMV